MYDPAANALTPPPPPPSSGDPNANPRWVYLVSRLRNRQITMEEATELFALQQVMLRNAPRSSAPATATPAPPLSAPLAVATAASADDLLWMSLLAIGAGSGVLAAVLKRARDGPADPSAPGSSGASSSSRAVP